MTAEYKKSLTELNTILNYMNAEYLKKIPNKLINFIRTNMDNDYIPMINRNVPIHKQNLSKDTKVLLSLIYRSYWCDKDKKEALKKQDLLEKQKYEEELYERYNSDNIFKNKNKKEMNAEINTVEETKQLVEYKPQNLIQRIINKIVSFFKRN